MIDFNSFCNFLKDEKIYQDNIELYDKLFHKITNDHITEWVITKFANGKPIADGNPIYSAFIESRKIAIRIIQVEIDTDKPIFSVWINHDPFEIKGIKELVISLQLRQDTFEDLSYLLEKFINQALSNHLIKLLNDKYKIKTGVNGTKRADTHIGEEVVTPIKDITLAPNRKAETKETTRKHYH
jgi:hypothetical protein